MSDETKTTPPAANAVGCSVDPVVSPLPCPFCGIEAKIMPAPYGPRVYCRHDSTCLLRANIVYDFQLREWNRRSVDQNAELERLRSMRANTELTGSSGEVIG